MSDMQPGKGVAVSIGGIRWHLLFTWAVVDKIQDLFQLPLSAVMKQFNDPMEFYKTAGTVLSILMEDYLRRNDSSAKAPTVEQVLRSIDLSMTQDILDAIIRAYRSQLPEVEEDDDEEMEEESDLPEVLNIPRLLLIGTTELKLSEDQFWDVTPRKFFRLVEEYQTMKGIKKPEQGIDDLP